ncbi:MULTISPECIES: MerR family transcriptional regulator [Enterococcus]|uniref:HTH merR-type domain-containing protein n=1 Tax=Enterococcus mundtii TaxID=53346 RepID=A0A1V2UAG7_ENTMU|nr:MULTISPECIES: MerR family transcriptional regulator [Enterococcus]NBA63643.1 MerR family transcriptional regulator [Enterococcus mundtii]ONN40259.1 hypothetical protein BTN92_15470 [Enterococcus mundtii]
MISINELSELYGVSIRTIRYYEEKGLINKAVRLKGKRYFTKNITLDKMNEIIFLKSLHLKLEDIRLAMENSLYVKPLLVNIRLGIVRMEIANLKEEVSKLERILQNYNWCEMKITNKTILEKMSDHYQNLVHLQKMFDEKNYLNSKDFVNYYKELHQKLGIILSNKHLRIIAFHPKVVLKDNIKRVFQNYFRE